MAVLKKIRSRLFAPPPPPDSQLLDVTVRKTRALSSTRAVVSDLKYDIRPLTLAHLDECWRLDQRCFRDGEAYTLETFEYLLTSADSVSYRAVTPAGVMVGFIVGLVEPDHTGHVTTLGVAPDHRRRGIARRMMEKVELGFRHRNVRLLRLEVRCVNAGAQQLYTGMGYAATQRLPQYYSNGGDGLLMIKSIDDVGREINALS